MSFEAMSWAVKMKLPVKQKIVLLMLADRTNKDTGRCDPSIPKLAEDCGMSETSVKEAIRSLRDAGLVEAHERKISGASLPNSYSLKMDEFPGGGRHAPQGGSPHDPGVGRHTPPNLEDKPGREPVIGAADADSHFEGSEDDVQSPDDAPLSDPFERFWAAYPRCPRKTDKPKAREAFWRIVQGKHKAIPRTDAAAIIDGAAARRGMSGEVEFYPLPTTWLNGARWEVHEGAAERRSSMPIGWQVFR